MRKVITTCVVVLMLAVVAICWHRSSILFECQLSKEHQLTIRQASSFVPNRVTLHITYHNPPAIGTYMVAQQDVTRPKEAITFTSLKDADTGIVCVFDNQDVGFLLMYNPKSDDLWDSTGRSGGWNGSDRSAWQSLLTQLRVRNPSIPYRNLQSGA